MIKKPYEIENKLAELIRELEFLYQERDAGRLILNERINEIPIEIRALKWVLGKIQVEDAQKKHILEQKFTKLKV